MKEIFPIKNKKFWNKASKMKQEQMHKMKSKYKY